ncbi:hypothetical protein NDI49_30215 [Trichocoleus sp. ST-U3]
MYPAFPPAATSSPAPEMYRAASAARKAIAYRVGCVSSIRNVPLNSNISRLTLKEAVLLVNKIDWRMTSPIWKN